LENHVALKFFATVFLMKFKEDSNIINRVTYKKSMAPSNFSSQRQTI